MRRRTVESGERYWAVHVDAQRTTVAAWRAYADGHQNEALSAEESARTEQRAQAQRFLQQG